MKNEIFVTLHYPLYEYGDKRSEFAIKLEKGSCIKDLIIKIGIPLGAFGFAVINETMVKVTHELQDKDKISMFPIVTGG